MKQRKCIKHFIASIQGDVIRGVNQRTIFCVSKLCLQKLRDVIYFTQDLSIIADAWLCRPCMCLKIRSHCTIATATILSEQIGCMEFNIRVHTVQL